MRANQKRGLALVASTALAASVLTFASVAPASATPVPFSQAAFAAYGTGSELHVDALTAGATTVAGVDQAFSGESTNSSAAMLTKSIASETGACVQPALAGGSAAYGRGSGLEVGLAAGNNCSPPPNQVVLPGLAQASAPPIGPPVIGQTIPVSIPPLADASAVDGRASAVFDPAACPLGQPLSYGEGDAADGGLITSGSTEVLSISGTGKPGTSTAVAQSQSYSYLSSNGDGTFGVTSVAKAIIAPITLSLPGDPSPAGLSITVQGENPLTPLTLTAVATGKPGGASVKVSGNATLVIAGTGALSIIPPTPFFLNTLTGKGLNVALPPAPNTIVSLGVGNPARSVQLGVTPPDPAIPPVTTNKGVNDGTTAMGAFDLLSLSIALPALTGAPALKIANLRLGHLEVGAVVPAGGISCTIPITKSASPDPVQVGNEFVYTILIPDPAHLASLACDLVNVNAVDTVGNKPGSQVLFSVVSADNGGIVKGNLVIWSGLTYKLAPSGSPPTPPITLHITVSIPANSPVGTMEDIVTSTQTLQNCTGGITGINNLGNVNGTVLNSRFTLDAPNVVNVAAKVLPHTGGGPVMPWVGVGFLAVAAGGFELSRRGRRRRTTVT
jgi:hypothetical protein